MKEQLTIISDDLNHGIITEKEARTKLLILFGVSTTVNCDNCDADNSAKYCEKCYIQADEGIAY